MDNSRKRLDDAIERRDTLAKGVQRVKGRLEAARKELETVEAKCREKGVDPEALDDAIQKLEARYEAEVEDLEDQLTKAEASLRPYVGEDR